jgi:hypothetical protein
VIAERQPNISNRAPVGHRLENSMGDVGATDLGSVPCETEKEIRVFIGGFRRLIEGRADAGRNCSDKANLRTR